MLKTSFSTASLSEQIAEHLTRQIVEESLPPNTKINEAYWSQTLDVSVNSLREALKILETKSLIEIKPRKGAWVCDVTQKQATELYDFIFMLLADLARRAANDWQLGELDDLQDALASLVENYQKGDLTGSHQVIFAALPSMLRFTRNAYMTKTILDFIPLLQRYSYIALQEKTSELDITLMTFHQLLNSVINGDAEEAARQITEYGKNQCQTVVDALQKREDGK